MTPNVKYHSVNSIYFIFSLGFVKKTIGSYIKYINPDVDGNVSFIGIIIYGLILGIIFILTRNYFIFDQ